MDKLESLIYLLDIIRNMIIGEKMWEGCIFSIGKKVLLVRRCILDYVKFKRLCVGVMVYIILKCKVVLI